MSGLFRRIPSIVVAVLFTLVASEARAGSYLYGLTEREIDEIMIHYSPRGHDRDAVLRQMAAPFDCRQFGDLCREIGEDSADRVLAGAWSMARMRYPLDKIERAVESDIEDLRSRWFERNYPDGVPDRDAYWEPMSSTGCRDTATATSGDFRIVNTSRRYNYIFSATGRVKVEHFKRSWTGNWNAVKADRLEVEGEVFVKFPGWSPFVFPVSRVEYDEKTAAKGHTVGFGIPAATIPYVEGCGFTTPTSSLFACTCSGEEPPIP
jgi:hypothetical protein